MADIEAFLRLDKNFKRINISAGTTAGRIDKSVGVRPNVKPRPSDVDYSAKYLKDQQEKLFQVIECPFFFIASDEIERRFIHIIVVVVFLFVNQRHFSKSNRPMNKQAKSFTSIQTNRIPFTKSTISIILRKPCRYCLYLRHDMKSCKKLPKIQWSSFREIPVLAKVHR